MHAVAVAVETTNNPRMRFASRRIPVYLSRSVPPQNYSHCTRRERIASQAQQFDSQKFVVVDSRYQRARALVTHRVLVQAEVSQAGAGSQQMSELLCPSIGDTVAPETELLKFEVPLQAPNECAYLTIVYAARAQQQRCQIGARADCRGKTFDAFIT